MGVAAILANIPLTQQFNYVKCKTYTGMGSDGIKVEVAASACEPTYLWGYLTGFLVGLNTLLPAILQILMNAYIIKVLVELKKRKGSVTIGKLGNTTIDWSVIGGTWKADLNLVFNYQ